MGTNRKTLTLHGTLILLLVATGLALTSAPVSADCGDGATLCVDADATGAATGLSWTNAYTNVQDALAATNANGATDYEIWVAAGVYYPDEGANTIADSPTMSFTVRYDNVQLYGGFAATETQRTERDWAAHVTVLSGDIDQNDTVDAHDVVTHTDNISGTNAYHVLWLDGVTHEPISTTTVIDGFTITAGQANSETSPDNYNWGGGLYCDGAGSGNACSPTLTNVTFSGNWADGNGGGMFNDSSDSGTSSPSLTNVTFSGNQAGEWGGGMYTAGNPTLTGVTFSDNRAVDYGGGMYNAGSPALTDVTFSGNRAVHWGGGMSNLGYDSISSPTLVNVIFSGNQADVGGGMFNYAVLEGGASSPVLTNATFSGNQADRGGGMYNWGVYGTSSPVLANVILWGNEAVTGTQIYNDAATPSVGYSLVGGGIGGAGIYNTNGGSVTDGGSNLDADPHFVAAPDPGADGTWGTSDDDHGDLRLSYRSPAIDAGNSLSVTTGTDLAGNPRIMGTAVDMGAYEVEKTTLTVSGAGTWLDFGPEICARVRFTTTGTLPTSVAITLTHETPSLNADGLPRRYEIVPTGGSNYAARLELCYEDDELPQAGIAPSEEPNLHAYRYAGSPTWVEYSTVDPVNNTVTADSVTDFGLWGLGIDSNQPTAVKMTALAAQPGRWPWLTATLLLGGVLVAIRFQRRRHMKTTKRFVSIWISALALALMGLSLTSAPVSAACGDGATLCVDADATGAATGLSWTNAYTNVQDALAVTNANGATDYEIWVAEGVYYPDEGTNTIADSRTMSFTVRYDNVQLYGGFAATETQRTERDWAAHVTVLSGDLGQDDVNTDGNAIAETWADLRGANAYHVLWLDGVSNEPISTTTVIDGFIITAGQAGGSSPHNAGGGLYCDGSGTDNACNPALANATFSGNQAARRGGGMVNNGANGGDSSPGLANVTFSGNQAGSFGGGMYNFSADGGTSSPTLTNVTFSGNRALYYGGGLYNYSEDGGTSSPTLTNVIFSGNQASDPNSSGGGMYNYSNYSVSGSTSSPVLTNVTFSGNRAAYGGGMYNVSSTDSINSPVLTNVTFSGNQAARRGGGMANSRTSGLQLTNVILWGNDAASRGNQMYNHYASLVLSYTLISRDSDDILNTISSITYGEGILSRDPQFVAPATGDYHLSANSPAIDAGHPNGATCPATDLDERPRNDLRCDIGAYERVYSEGDTVIKRDFTAGAPTSFGPTWISMTLGADDAGTLTITKHITYPGGTYDPGEFKATWFVTGTIDLSASQPITLSFCYTDTEISRDGLDESSLGAYCWDGTQWTTPISDSMTVYEDDNCLTLTGAIDQADNCVTNVDQYSAWTLQDTSSASVPNALSLHRLNARSGVIWGGLLLALAGICLWDMFVGYAWGELAINKT